MVIETLTIIYYSIASLSVGLVLCQTYKNEINKCINKYIYNYELIETEEHEETEETEENEKYILFNEMEPIIEKKTETINIKTKKNVIIDFE